MICWHSWTVLPDAYGGAGPGRERARGGERGTRKWVGAETFCELTGPWTYTRQISYDRVYWKYCTPEIYQIEKVRFLGTNSKQSKDSICFLVPRDIEESEFSDLVDLGEEIVRWNLTYMYTIYLICRMHTTIAEVEEPTYICTERAETRTLLALQFILFCGWFGRPGSNTSWWEQCINPRNNIYKWDWKEDGADLVEATNDRKWIKDRRAHV